MPLSTRRYADNWMMRTPGGVMDREPEVVALAMLVASRRIAELQWARRGQPPPRDTVGHGADLHQAQHTQAA